MRRLLALAYQLGKTVGELTQFLTIEELNLWLAFEELEGPVGPMRDDLRSVQTSATITNLFRKQHQGPVNPLDLIPDWGRNRARQKLAQSIQSWQAFGAKLEAMQHGS